MKTLYMFICTEPENFKLIYYDEKKIFRNSFIFINIVTLKSKFFTIVSSNYIHERRI